MFTREQRPKATKLIIFCVALFIILSIYFCNIPHQTTNPPPPLLQKERDQVDKQK